MKSLIVLLALSVGILTSCGPRIVHHQSEKVVLVKTPPKQHRIVVVKGKRYYTWNGKHYRKTRRGYILVAL